MTTTSVAAQPPLDKKVYLGDGLYAEFDGYHIEVYASNGVTNGPSIYFDRGTADSFIRFAKRVMGND